MEEIKCPYCGGASFNRASYGKQFGIFNLPLNTDVYICQNCGKEIGTYKNGLFVYFKDIKNNIWNIK